MCLDMDDFYLAGEPGTNSAASLIIRIKPNPDLLEAKTADDTNNGRNQGPMIDREEKIHITFSQL